MVAAPANEASPTPRAAADVEHRARLDASTELHRHRWAPPEGALKRARGVYLLHGTGEHGARYERLARRLAAAGWHVGAHDHAGHGRSGGVRGRLPTTGSYATQAADECERFAAETGAMPFVFGHSLGCVVAGEMVLLNGVRVAGLVLSAPAIVPRLTLRDSLKLRTLSLFAPSLALELPYEPTHLTHDPEQQRVALADPWIHGFKSAGKIGWLMRTAERVLRAGSRLDVDALVLIAGDDVVIDTARTREFVANAPAHRVTVHTYEGGHHELLNERPALRERVADDIVDWLDARDAAAADPEA